MELQKISDIAILNCSSSIQEALDEIRRELAVRSRIYDRWVAEGRQSYTEARDRYCRLAVAARIVQKALDLQSIPEPEAIAPDFTQDTQGTREQMA
jgi:hypothetical protein